MKKIFIYSLLFSALCTLQIYTADATTLVGSQGGTGISTTTIGNVGKLLQVQSVAPLIWGLANASGSGGGSSTVVNGVLPIVVSGLLNGNQTTTFSTTTPLTIGATYTFNSGIVSNGNVTTTNETVSSTLQLTDVTPSGTVTYPLSVDGSSFLNLGPVTGNSPGSGAVSTQEYNIVEQNCPNNASTSNQSECDWSMSTVYPDGNRVFTDLNQESYPGFNSTGWFETATGASSTGKAFLYPYYVEMSNYPAATSTISHHAILTAVPVNATGTWAGVNWTQTGNSVVVGTDEITGNLLADSGVNVTGNVSTTGQVNINSAGNGAQNTYRGGTGNYATNCIGTGSTAWWCLQLSPDGTNNLTLVDSQDGGNVIKANTNGSTTIGNSGTGTGVIAATPFTASTTLTVNQTSTLLAKLSVGTSSDPGKATLLVNGQAKFPMPVLATATTASTIVDFSVSERQMLTLGAATTTIYVTNTEPGDTDLLKLCQDGTGSRTATFMASSTNTTSTIYWGLAGLPTLSTTTYYCDDFSFVTSPQARNIASSVVEGLYGLNQFAY